MLPAKTRIWIASATILLLVAVKAATVSAGPVAALEVNDNIPGEPMTTWSVEGSGDALGDSYDVYSVALVAGATTRFTCTASYAQDFNIYLYPSTATDIEPASQRIAGAARIWAFHGAEEFDFTPETTGTYYLLVETASGEGNYQLSRRCVPSLTAVGASSITLGQTLHVDGALSSLDPAAHVAGQVVSLYMTTPDMDLPPIQTTTAANGAFAFVTTPSTGITWYVIFDGAEGLAPTASDEHITDVSNPGGGPPGPSVGGAVSGIVRAGPTALAGVSIQVGSMAPVISGADGAYSVSGVVPGTYNVTFAKDGYVTETLYDVEFRAGETVQHDVALNVDTSVLRATLTGSVTASGSALVGVSVQVGSMAAAVTNASGQYTVSDIKPGTYGVTFSQPGYVPQTLTGVTFLAGASVTRDVVLLPDSSNDASSALSGTVRSTDGQALSSVKVSLDSTTTTTTGADGVYRFSGITPGTYSVTFEKLGYVTKTLNDVAIAPNASISVDATLSTMPSLPPAPPTTPAAPKLRVSITPVSPSGTVTIYRRRAGIVRYTLSAVVRTSKGAPGQAPVDLPPDTSRRSVRMEEYLQGHDGSAWSCDEAIRSTRIEH